LEPSVYTQGMSKTSKRRRNRPESTTAVAYVRVSTWKQKTHGVGLDAQHAAIQRTCDMLGLGLIQVFTDEGVSGRKGVQSRPGLAAAIKLAKSTGSTLVCYSLSRLARSVGHLRDVLDELTKAGCEFVSCTETIDTSSGCGRFVLGILAHVAELESDLASERTLEAMAGLRAAGRKTGGESPYGYRVSKSGKLAKVASEQRVIEAMRGLRKGGLSLRRIVEVLDAEGMRRRDGKPFKLTQVVRILEREERERVAA